MSSIYEVTIVLKFDRFPSGKDIDDAIKELSENRGVVADILCVNLFPYLLT